MEYNFNRGDKVITSDGRKGVITEICNCDLCRKRGFFEPKVSFDNDLPIWITDTDFYNGFSEFYSIGEYYFGNIDDMAPLEERIRELDYELFEIRRRLASIRRLMVEKGRQK